jgi:hypothetical protein
MSKPNRNKLDITDTKKGWGNIVSHGGSLDSVGWKQREMKQGELVPNQAVLFHTIRQSSRIPYEVEGLHLTDSLRSHIRTVASHAQSVLSALALDPDR